MFDGFLDFFGSILAWFYSLVPSYGLAITFLTLTVMIVITPLTLKSTRSMMQMQRLQPELKRLQEKYKDDRERLNTELMAFYKANNLNPLSGCVPVLAQLPIFIILYNLMRGLTIRVGGGGSGIGHVVGQMRTGTTFTPWIFHDQPFQPRHVDGTELFDSLSNSSTMRFLGMDLSLSPFDAIKIGIITAIPFIILMVALLVSQIIQNRQIQGRNKNRQQQMPSQQQALMKVLPFMLPVFSFSFPAGLGYYYFVQGLCRIGTQAYITRKYYGDEDGQAVVVVDTTAEERPKGRSPKSGNSKSSTAEKSSSGNGSRKPGSSAKSKAVQKKAAGGGSSSKSAGRKSGAPRSGGSGPSGKR